MSGLPLWPAQASSYAGQLDTLFVGLLVITGLTTALVMFLMVVFAIRYRQGSSAERTVPTTKTWRWEVSWTAASFLIFIGLAMWGADLYIRLYQPPHDSLQIFVVGKQWMWKAQHPDGQREINALHVPVNRDVRLVMASQDVIHSFYVPALRLKHDVVPGRYESMWFRADRPGRYRFFCAEYCGTDHARMGGWLTVMSERDFAGWLRRQGGRKTLAQAGADLFRNYGCSGCHDPGGTVRAPPLQGLYGNPVPLSDGRIVRADEAYVRDSIMLPKKDVAAGYAPVMPSFAGQVSEDDLVKLVAYVQSLGNQPPPRGSR